ncbi:MAG: molybdopterin-dependent oxidoreductase [Planctomycetota bacterium]
MPIHESVCPLDCPDSCSLAVEVEDERVVSVDGTHRNPLTAGFICAKVRRFPRLIHGPGRVPHPLRRVGAKGEGRFERISWDAALDLLTERLEAARAGDPASILPITYGGSNGSLSHGTLDERFFRRVGASRLARTLCAAPTGAAATGLYGRMAGVALTDYAHARLIVLWGVNPQASGIHLVPVIEAAREQGAKLVVIDPRRTQLAARADLHLAPRPGTDLPLALGLIDALFARGRADEEFLARWAHADQVALLRERAGAWPLARAAEVAGVAPDDLELLYELYAGTRPAVIRCGWGLERNRNGGSAAAAVMALPAVAGHFGLRGGGYTMSNSGAWDLDLDAAVRAPEPPTRLINLNQVGRALLEAEDPRVSLAFVYDCNPAATLPDQERVRAGLMREDLFTVVFEQVMSDTVAFADLVLPATTFFEHDELQRGYGALIALRGRPAIPPVGEARSNIAVFGALLERLGLARADDPTTPDELCRALLGAERAARLEREGSLEPPCGAHPVQMVDSLPKTPDGKVHLVPASLEAMAPGGLYAYREPQVLQAFPLTLISPASTRAITSTLFQLHEGVVPLELDPADAAARGIADGARVRAWNDLGEVVTVAKLTDALRPGVCLLPKGLWAKHTLNGRSSNALSPDTLTDLGGGACFNDARVEVALATA